MLSIVQVAIVFNDHNFFIGGTYMTPTQSHTQPNKNSLHLCHQPLRRDHRSSPRYNLGGENPVRCIERSDIGY